MEIIKIRERFAAYQQAVNGSNPGKRREVLEEMLGLQREPDAFLTAIRVLKPDVLWQYRAHSPRDSASVLQMERMAAEDAVNRYGFCGRPEEENARCLTSLIRLYLAERLPDVVRDFANLLPKEYHPWLQPGQFARACAAYELMLPEKFNISHVQASGVSVTREQLGNMFEGAKAFFRNSGGF